MNDVDSKSARSAARRIIRACGLDPDEVTNFNMYPDEIRFVLWPEGGPGSGGPNRRVTIRLDTQSQFWTGK